MQWRVWRTEFCSISIWFFAVYPVILKSAKECIHRLNVCRSVLPFFISSFCGVFVDLERRLKSRILRTFRSYQFFGTLVCVYFSLWCDPGGLDLLLASVGNFVYCVWKRLAGRGFWFHCQCRLWLAVADSLWICRFWWMCSNRFVQLGIDVLRCFDFRVRGQTESDLMVVRLWCGNCMGKKHFTGIDNGGSEFWFHVNISWAVDDLIAT